MQCPFSSFPVQIFNPSKPSNNLNISSNQKLTETAGYLPGHRQRSAKIFQKGG